MGEYDDLLGRGEYAEPSRDDLLAQVAALTAERDRLRVDTNINADEVERQRRLLDLARAELAAANTRCAELEAKVEGYSYWSMVQKNAALQVTLDRVTAETESVIDAIEETFLPQLPSKALSYCAQEDVNAGLDAMRERFGLEAGR